MRRIRPDFAAQLRACGFRVTPGHEYLLWLLWCKNRSLTVDEIGRNINLNITTVYRDLNAFADAGIILRGMGSGDAMEFSYTSGKHHHHLICADCGFIKTCTNCL